MLCTFGIHQGESLDCLNVGRAHCLACFSVSCVVVVGMNTHWGGFITAKKVVFTRAVRGGGGLYHPKGVINTQGGLKDRSFEGCFITMTRLIEVLVTKKVITGTMRMSQF